MGNIHYCIAVCLLTCTSLCFAEKNAKNDDTLNPNIATKANEATVIRGTQRPVTHAKLEVDLTLPLGPVNRKLYGVTLPNPTIAPNAAELMKPFLRGASIRLWPYAPNEGAWQPVMEFIKETQPAWVFAWVPHSSVPFGTYYNSLDDHNMPTGKSPREVAEYVRWVNKTPHPGYPNGYNILHWEIWNEPEHNPRKGFPPESYAQYVIDCSRLIKEVDPRVTVGAFLPTRKYSGDENWADIFLRVIRERAPDAIDFIDNHQYNGLWWEVIDEYGSYLPRVAFPELIVSRFNDSTVERVKRFGDYKIINSEWNIHPPIPRRWEDMPIDHMQTTYDLGAAIYAAGALLTYMDTGDYYALEFHRADRKQDRGMCGLLAINSDGLAEVGATYKTFKLFGEHFDGMRYDTEVWCDTFRLPIENPVKVSWNESFPYVVAGAALNDKTLTLMVVNREPDLPLRLSIDIKGWGEWNGGPPIPARRISLVGEAPESLETNIELEEVKLARGPKNISASSRQIDLPKHSVNVILIDYEGH